MGCSCPALFTNVTPVSCPSPHVIYQYHSSHMSLTRHYLPISLQSHVPPQTLFTNFIPVSCPSQDVLYQSRSNLLTSPDVIYQCHSNIMSLTSRYLPIPLQSLDLPRRYLPMSVQSHVPPQPLFTSPAPVSWHPYTLFTNVTPVSCTSQHVIYQSRSSLLYLPTRYLPIPLQSLDLLKNFYKCFFSLFSFLRRFNLPIKSLVHCLPISQVSCPSSNVVYASLKFLVPH